MIYRLTVELFQAAFEFKECIRVIEIDEQATLRDLHLAIQDAVRFDNDHLYEFFVSNRLRGRRIHLTGEYAGEITNCATASAKNVDFAAILPNAAEKLNELRSADFYEIPPPPFPDDEENGLLGDDEDDEEVEDDDLLGEEDDDTLDDSEEPARKKGKDGAVVAERDAPRDEVEDDAEKREGKDEENEEAEDGEGDEEEETEGEFDWMEDEEDEDEECEYIDPFTLKEVFPIKDAQLYYLFDFGDEWIFQIKKDRVEKPPKRGVKYPRVVKKIGRSPEQYPEWD